ncbi:MAG TPA: nicotinamide-nucleotide amidohydrolase family protein [Methylomirabilota bacterium]|nr:nicotinamide-nucleotide amidohydrolase family protein [Methylomirabilota bacterium]
MTPGAIVVGLGAAGPTIDEAAATAAAVLAGHGLPAAARVLVEDDEAALDCALSQKTALTVLVAGPGGSSGDVLRRALARLAGVRLVLSERMLAAQEEASRRRDRPLARRADRQALLPQGATVLPVADGEPAWSLAVGPRLFLVVPFGAALATTLEQHLAPLAQARLGGRQAGVVRTLRLAGVTLADVEERLAEWLGSGAAAGEVEVSTLPGEGEVWVRLRARGATPTAASEALTAVEAKLAPVLAHDCYGRDGDTLERVVGRLLVERRLTLALAESCTGGLVGHRITSVPGSSAYFERGVMVYSNRAKEEMLGVSPEILRTHGAVSAPCAEAMARGICTASGAACGVSVTGIAGPDGGSPAKPVGTVFVGVAVAGEVSARRFGFSGDRASIKWQSAQAALDLLRRALLARPVEAPR